MDGFEKIDLTKQPKTPVQVQSTMRRQSGRAKKKTIYWVTAGILVFLFLIFGVLIPTIRLISQAKVTYTQAKAAYSSAKNQNLEDASSQLDKTKEELAKAQKDLHVMGYLAFIPIANWYYNDADHLVKAGLYGLDGGKTLIESVAPYADVLGFKGKGSFVGGSAQDRIQTAVMTLGKITPNIDKIGVSLTQVKQELDQVDPNHYPPFFGGEKIRSKLATLRTVVDEADTFVTQATPLIKVLPEELGEPTTKRYLVIFQNDKEIRPTGGFMTAYAIMRLEHGVIHAETSQDIYSLDATIANKPSAPRPLRLYLPKVPELNIRDTNLSPDFVTSMDSFNNLYVTAGDYRKVDGIIAIDTYPLVDAMNILGGEMEVDGTKFTTKTDPRCNCPQVIYELEAYSDQPVNYVKTNRKGLIGDLMLAIMNKAFSSSPKLYWGPLFQAIITDTAQKHILFDIYNADAQQGVEALNAGGRVRSFDGDYLHINEANFGGAKSNLYVTETVDQNYQVNSDGTISKTVKVTYKNPYPPSDCSLLTGGLCLNAVLRDWIRFYVPKGSQLTSNVGSEVKMTSYEELGKTVFEGFLTVRPQGAAIISVTYTLPFKLAHGSPLPAMYQKQPGTNANVYTVSVNGNQVQQFPLDTDKTIKLNL